MLEETGLVCTPSIFHEWRYEVKMVHFSIVILVDIHILDSLHSLDLYTQFTLIQASRENLKKKSNLGK